jgi:phenylacetate-CoA ligase
LSNRDQDIAVTYNWLQPTLSHLYQHAPAFRKRLDVANLAPGQLDTPEALAQLSILRKDDLIELQKADPPFCGLLAIPLTELKSVYQSPGPINEPGMGQPDAGRWGVALRAAGFQAGDVVLNAFGYHLTPAGASLEDSLHTVGCVVIPGGIGNQEQQIQAMASFGAVGYVGLPSYLLALLNKAVELGHNLTIRNAFVLAEPLPPSLRQALNDRGVKVYQGYGTAECGNLGYEVNGYAGWRIPEEILVQICDINSGEPLPHGQTGEVVVTLPNTHYALVRFGVGDLSAIIPESAHDGGGLRLKGWLGRVGAATKVRGMFLHPTQLANLMQRFDEVAAYQAVITRAEHRDELALQVVPTAQADPSTLPARLAEAARSALKFRFAVTLVDTLPADAPPICDDRQWE